MPKNSLKNVTGKGIFPHQWAFTLLIPFRNIFLSPKKLIKRLDLKEEAHVLEIGPGPGYFSVKVAQALPKGKLYLFDIQQEMLDYAWQRLEKRKCHNVEYHLADGETFPFEDGQFDRIFMVTVIGEVENQAAYLREIHRVLKPDGLVSVSELAGDPDKMTVEELESVFSKAGFRLDKQFGSERNFTVNFRKDYTNLSFCLNTVG